MKQRGAVIWRYPNPYRVFCWRWWKHVAELPQLLWMDIRDAYLRARYGWAPCDIWDLCSYHCALTIGLLEEYSKNHDGHPSGMTPEEYQDKIDTALMGWKAMSEIINDTQYMLPYDRYTEWQDRMYKVFEVGMEDFIKIYPSLWN